MASDDIEQSIDLKKDMSGTANLKMGIDFENGFKETYQIVEGKEKVVEELKKSKRYKRDVY